MFLRWTGEGMSRLWSTKEAQFNVQWRAALGLHLGTQTPDEKTVREFEAFLLQRHPSCGMPRYLLLHEHIVRLCLDAEVVGQSAVWATDSTPMWCYGAVLDTVRLLGDGTRMLVRQWASATRQSFVEVARSWEIPHLLAKSTKGAFRIDWRDPAQRNQVLEQVVAGALRAVERVRSNIDHARPRRHGRLLRRCRQLTRVISQGVETGEDGGLVIARKVARDRLVSLTDGQARHGRKTQSKLFHGFKLHLLGDVVSGLISAVTVTPGNKHDASVAHRLIRRAKQLYDGIDHVLGDTAYGGATLRHNVQKQCGVTLLAPPPAQTRRQADTLGRQDIQIDFDTQTATCAAGISTALHKRVWASDHGCLTSTFRWPKTVCAVCPLKQRCCGSRHGGLLIRLHPHERELRKAREDWSNPAVRNVYRTRSQCERLVNQMVRHGAR